MERKRGQVATMTAQPCRWTLEYAILRMNATTCKCLILQRSYLLNCFWLLSDVIFSGKVGPLAIVLQDLASVAKVNSTAKSDPLVRFYILGWLTKFFTFLCGSCWLKRKQEDQSFGCLLRESQLPIIYQIRNQVIFDYHPQQPWHMSNKARSLVVKYRVFSQSTEIKNVSHCRIDVVELNLEKPKAETGECKEASVYIVGSENLFKVNK